MGLTLRRWRFSGAGSGRPFRLIILTLNDFQDDPPSLYLCTALGHVLVLDRPVAENSYLGYFKTLFHLHPSSWGKKSEMELDGQLARHATRMSSLNWSYIVSFVVSYLISGSATSAHR